MHKFKKLVVWQESLEFIKQIYALCNKLPSIEERNIRDQLRRSAISVSLNIAEGSGSENDTEFKRYLYISKKSLFEVFAILEITKFLYKVDTKTIEEKASNISKMLTGLIKYLKSDDRRPNTEV